MDQCRSLQRRLLLRQTSDHRLGSGRPVWLRQGGLLHMFPILMTKSFPYAFFGDSELSRHHDACEFSKSPLAANPKNVLRGQFSVSYVPSFYRHIPHIFQLSPMEKMCRITTSRVVAGMKNINPFRNRTIRQFPCHTMTPQKRNTSRRSNNSVSVLQRARPRPAFVYRAFSNTAPKPLFKSEFLFVGSSHN